MQAPTHIQSKIKEPVLLYRNNTNDTDSIIEEFIWTKTVI